LHLIVKNIIIASSYKTIAGLVKWYNSSFPN
jgi:hypothetical protein